MNRVNCVWRFSFFPFSANLGYLGVLGDRHFLESCGAYRLCAAGTQKKPIAEDAEIAEVRREKPSRNQLSFMISAPCLAFGAFR
jgi:hypothetical protein